MPKVSQPKFEVIKPNENPYNAVIKSTVKEKDFTTEFTIGDVEKSIAALSRLKQELEAKKMIEEAKVQNIKNQHPEIDLTIDEKIQIAYTIAQTAKSFCFEADKKIAQIDEQLKDYADDLLEVFKQTGLKLPEKDDTK